MDNIRVTKLEKQYAVMNNKLDNVSEKVGEVKSDLEKYIVEDRAWKEKLFKEMKGQFAGKWVESLLVMIIGGVAVAVIVWLVTNS